jgi:RimJ/RimL family protein N-acetyltransferase
MRVRHVVKGEADRLRQLRLAALATDPDAFGSTLARDAAHPQEHWERWAAESDAGNRQRTFVLVDDEDRWHGLALVRHDADEPGTAVLHGMWVAPGIRGRRLGVLLSDACAAWATQQGLRELTLAVVIGNEPALRAYEAAGFVVRGKTTWRQAGRALDELVMARRLTPVPRM